MMESGTAQQRAEPTDRLTGDAPTVHALRAQIRHLATFDRLGSAFVPTLLLQGETGTGKGLVASIVHESGPRASGRFITVNCAALPENLLEAELFGFEAGAFTDAKRPKSGLLEEASDGTLFLDEIDSLPLSLQAKLLSVLEGKRARRLGAVAEREIDVKLIAATQSDLSVAVSTGRFRLDLFHRLAMVVLTIPPLRERREDILTLARQFLAQAAENHNLLPKRLSRAAEAWIIAQNWPGNVRELRHLMERITLLSHDAVIEPPMLQQWSLGQPQPAASPQSALPAERQPTDEATEIRQALASTGGNVARAARILGVSRKALRYRMGRYGIERPSLPGPIPVPEPIPADSATIDRREGATVPDWELKPVVVLAFEMTFPSSAVKQPLLDDPWSVSVDWEKVIVAEVQKFGGVVLQRTPPTLIIAFGVPRAMEQMPQRAIHAALAIQREVASAGLAGRPESRPDVRSAAHLGAVFVHARSSDAAQQVLGVGETLALPLRLLGVASAGDIVVSPEVARLVAAWFTLQPRESALTVTGVKPVPSLVVMHGERPLAPFVGRRREITALFDLLSQAESGRGQLLGVVGEPGVGKSRLVYEFRQSLSQGRTLYLEGRCLAYGGAIPYLPVLDLVRACCGIAETDSADVTAEKVRDRLKAAGVDGEAGTADLLQLLGMSPEPRSLGELSPEASRIRTFEILRHLLLRTNPSKLLILVIEDLHWVDSISEAFFASLADHLAVAPILMLVTYRPGYRPPWLEKSYATQMTLQALSSAESESLVQAVLFRSKLPDSLVQHILAKAEGNPFFLEELARAVIEESNVLSTPTVPSTIQGVLMARIDRLAAAPKRVLQTASVFGREVPLKLLKAICEEPDSVDKHLPELQRLEFLFERIAANEPVYLFKHALTQETAYKSVPLFRRLVLHKRIVEVLEALNAEPVAEQIGWLAHHAVQGEVWDKALAYCHQAGEKSMARSANQEAVTYFEQALDALKRLPVHDDGAVQRIDLWLNLHAALLPSGNSERILATLREAEALAEAQQDSRQAGQVFVSLSQYFFLTGEYEQSMLPARRALTLAAARGDSVLRGLANQRLGLAHWAQGDYRKSIECLTEAIASLHGMPHRERFGLVFLPAVFSRALLACCYAELGSFVEGQELADQGLEIAEAVDHPASCMSACWGAGVLALRKGDLSRALSLLERAINICQEADLPVWFPRMAEALGAAYAQDGRIDEAVLLLTRAVEQSTSSKTLAFPALCNLSLAALASPPEDAQVLAESALAHTRRHQERGNEAYALRLLGDIAARRKPSESELAEVHYRQALDLSVKLGMRPLKAHCHLSLGTLYVRIGRGEPARAELMTATELYDAMDMTFWSSQVKTYIASPLLKGQQPFPQRR